MPATPKAPKAPAPKPDPLKGLEQEAASHGQRIGALEDEVAAIKAKLVGGLGLTFE